MLLIHLPLNNSVKNQGILGDVLTSSGVTFSENSKIGRYSIKNGTITVPSAYATQVLNANEFSYCCWIYVLEGSGSSIIFGNNEHRRYTLFQYPTRNDFHWSWLKQGENEMMFTGQSVLSNVLPDNTWTHICVTYKKPYGKIYINSKLIYEFTGEYADNQSFSYDLPIYSEETQNLRNICDIRVYDNCINQQEINDIYQNCILHYPMRDQDKSANRIPAPWTFSGLSNNCVSIFNFSTQTLDGISTRVITCTTASEEGFYWSADCFNNTIGLKNNIGDDFTISFEIKANRYMPNFPTYHESADRGIVYDVSQEWTRVVYRFKIIRSSSYTALVFYYGKWKVGDIIYLRNFKFELGDNPYSALTTYGSVVDNLEYDCSGYSKNATCYNISVDTDTSKNTLCYKFNGSDSYLDLGSQTINMNDCTFTCYFKFNSFSELWSRIFDFMPSHDGEDTSYGILLAHNGTTNILTLHVYNSITYSITTEIELNKWYYCAVTIKNETVSLYLDNELIKSETMDSSLYQKTIKYCYIGKSNWTVDGYLNGCISDFKIFNRSLSLAEITNLDKIKLKLNENLICNELIEI